MQPIGPLMREHRLIERLLRLVEFEVQHIESGGKPDTSFIDQAVDFFRTYADLCHHGKEEDILFRELAKKSLSPADQEVLAQLVAEHATGRALVRTIFETNRSVALSEQPEAANALVPPLRTLIDFYPVHIEKEDLRFFHPVMRHFSRQEMDAMLSEFEEFDKKLLHEKYADLVSAREGALR